MFLTKMNKYDEVPKRKFHLPELKSNSFKSQNARYLSSNKGSISKIASIMETNQPEGEMSGETKEAKKENPFLKERPRAFSGLRLNSFNEDGNLRVLHITWNMGGMLPKGDLNKDLFKSKETQHHIICISSQECAKSILANMWNENKQKWEDKIKEHLGISYIPIKSMTRNAMHIMVLAHTSVYSHVKDVDTSRVCCGVANMCFNKGALAIGFRFVKKSFVFICCHLTSGQSKSKKRVADFSKIEKGLKLDKCYNYLTDLSTNRFDYVFWSGDFNFRVDLSSKEVLSKLSKDQFAVLLL